MNSQTVKNRSAVAIVVSLSVLVIGAIVVGATLSVFVMREQEIDQWKRQIDNLSLIMAENTSQAYSNVIFSTSVMVNPLYFTSKVSRL